MGVLVETANTLFGDMKEEVKQSLFAVVMMNLAEIYQDYPEHAVVAIIGTLLEDSVRDLQYTLEDFLLASKVCRLKSIL